MTKIKLDEWQKCVIRIFCETLENEANEEVFRLINCGAFNDNNDILLSTIFKVTLENIAQTYDSSDIKVLKTLRNFKGE